MPKAKTSDIVPRTKGAPQTAPPSDAQDLRQAALGAFAELGGFAPAPPAPAQPQAPQVKRARRLLEVPGIREACRKGAGEPDAEPDFLPRLRSVAAALSFLQHDTPERQALLRAAGLDAAAGDHLAELAGGWAEGALRAADEFHASEEWLHLKYRSADEPATPGGEPFARRLSEVRETQIEWLWPQRIPLGKLTLVQGDPGKGKSWIVLDVLARLTTGRGFPDGRPNPFLGAASCGTGCPRRDVLWASAEDADEDTIKPRFRLLGGDGTRFYSVRSPCALSLRDSLDHIAGWLREHPLVAAVALDPFHSFMGGVDTHKNADVRGVLGPLSELADEHRVSIIGINHLNKAIGTNATHRGMGSIAFNAAARAVWQVMDDPDDPGRQLFVKVKANCQSEDVGGLAYRLVRPDGGLVWERGEVDVTADMAMQLAARQDGDARAPAKAEAKEWLRELLADGPVEAGDAWPKADADGLCRRTVKAALKELGVSTVKGKGRGAGWVWSLPKQ